MDNPFDLQRRLVLRHPRVHREQGNLVRLLACGLRLQLLELRERVRVSLVQRDRLDNRFVRRQLEIVVRFLREIADLCRAHRRAIARAVRARVSRCAPSKGRDKAKVDGRIRRVRLGRGDLAVRKIVLLNSGVVQCLRARGLVRACLGDQECCRRCRTECRRRRSRVSRCMRASRRNASGP